MYILFLLFRIRYLTPSDRSSRVYMSTEYVCKVTEMAFTATLKSTGTRSSQELGFDQYTLRVHLAFPTVGEPMLATIHPASCEDVFDFAASRR